MNGFRDVFSRALKTKRSSAYLFVEAHPHDHDGEGSTGVHDTQELVVQTKRPMVRSCTQITLDTIQSATKFSAKEVNALHREFKHECPTGYVTQDQFRLLYQKFFPLGGSGRYAGYVFNTFDRDHNGHVTFRAFLLGMSVLSRGNTEEKLKWIFSLYDIDKNGFITKNEMVEIVSAVHEMRNEARPGYPTQLDNDAIINHATNVFKKMDVNHDGIVSYDEFAQACYTDEDIRKTIGSLNGGLQSGC